MWKTSRVEGVNENGRQFWIHHIRDNQYKFTEVAPFPDVNLPANKKVKIKSTLQIEEGWGAWTNEIVQFRYKHLGKSTFNLSGKTIDYWQFFAKSRASFGKSQILYKFSDEYGFVEMKYENYNKETLVFTLVEAIEK